MTLISVTSKMESVFHLCTFYLYFVVVSFIMFVNFSNHSYVWIPWSHWPGLKWQQLLIST